VSTTLDCAVLGDLYGTQETRAAFTSRALVQGWLDAERALAESQAECGVIPAAAAARIATEADAERYDLAALRSGIADSQHPLVPLVRALADRCGEHGAWVHWGATTQDVIDTGLVLQVRAALRPIERDVDRALTAAARLARAHAGTAAAGRTHGQHAVPITFGLKAASWADELERARSRLRRAADGVLTAQLGGAAGTLAAMGDAAEAVRRAFSRRLALAHADVPWHAARDRVRDLGHGLAELAGAAERIACEVIRLQATEVAEVSEPIAPGHVGSSTMPQKRNPMICEYLVASARLARGPVRVLADAAAHAGERDMGLWATEWLAVPQAMILSGSVADKLAGVLEGLQVDTDRMRANLGATRGQVMAESAMMLLAVEVGHERAHAIVGTACRRASAVDRDLAEVLADTPEVSALLGRDRIERALRPEAYTGRAESFAQRVARRVLDPDG
jgi:3-carboxy-cis,cis-muconate cycloisomerase